MSENVLVNLALLESIRAKKQLYYIDYFALFLSSFIQDEKKDNYDFSTIKALLEDNLNLKIPINSVKLIVERCVKRKLLKKNDDLLVPNYKAIEKILKDLKSRKSEALDSQKAFFDYFVNYIDKKYNKKIDADFAEELFSEYIKHYQIDILECIQKKDTFTAKGKSVNNPDYLVSSYIKHIYEKNEQVFDYFVKTIKGYILANHLILRGDDTDRDNLKGITVVLDTPIIMGLLGFSDESRETTFNEMLSLLHELKVKVTIFQHTFDEVEGIFTAWKNDLRSRNLGNFNTSILTLLMEKGYDDVAIGSYIPRIKKIIISKKIEIIEKPEYVNKYQMDEEEFKIYLIKCGFPDVKSRLDRDIDSMSAIYRFRKAKPYVDFRDKPVLFTTSTKKLVSCTNSYFSRVINSNSLPIAIDDIWLTNLIWFMKPNLFPDLPKNIIVSNCYSIISEDDKFWEDFLDRLRRLKRTGKLSNEDYKVVRYEIDLKICLKDTITESGSEYKDETVLDIVNRTKEKIFAEKDEKIEKYRRYIGIKREENELLKLTADRAENDKEKLSALLGFLVCLLIFIIMELIVLGLSIEYGAGENNFQRIASSWCFFGIPLAIIIPVGYLIIGKERLKYLPSQVKNYFMRIDEEN